MARMADVCFWPCRAPTWRVIWVADMFQALFVVCNRQGICFEPFGLIFTGGMSTKVDEHTMVAYMAVHGGCVFFRGFWCFWVNVGHLRGYRPLQWVREGPLLWKHTSFSIGGPIFDEIRVHGEHGGLMAAHGGCVFFTMSGTDMGHMSVRHVPGTFCGI